MTRSGIGTLQRLVMELSEKEGLRPFSRRTGLPLGVIRSIAAGRDISVSNAFDACERLGLEFYLGPPRIPECDREIVARPVADVRLGDADFALIARYDVNVSAGPGLIPASEGQDGQLAFTRSWLRRHSIDPELSGLVRVRGDSMAPMIPDRALVLVHTAECVVEREGVFAFCRRGENFIKKLMPVERGPDGRPTSLVIISENPDYPTEVVTGRALNDLRVVGRVRHILVDL